MQIIAHLLPMTYVFESLKALIGQGDVMPEKLLISLGLTVLYALLAAFLFKLAFANARREGRLLQTGE
jgi:ABC-type polysaccharide/polyol phosphate export permease